MARFCKLIIMIIGYNCLQFSIYAQNWYTVDKAKNQITTTTLDYAYVVRRFPQSPVPGIGIYPFKDSAGNNYSNSIDVCGTGYAKYDQSEATIKSITDKGKYLELSIVTGKMDMLQRIYKGTSILEIEYVKRSCIWNEDKIAKLPNSLFVMHGLDDMNVEKWRSVSNKAKMNGEPFGDRFIEAAGGTISGCLYRGYFIFGIIDQKTGRGIAFLHPAKVTSGAGAPVAPLAKSNAIQFDAIKDWKIWDDFSAIEYFGFSAKRRWIYAVSKGKSEVMEVGKAILDNGASSLANTSTSSISLENQGKASIAQKLFIQSEQGLEYVNEFRLDGRQKEFFHSSDLQKNMNINK